MAKRYEVTMRCVVFAESDKKALDALDKAADEAMKVAIGGVDMDVEEMGTR